ncbi:MAG: LLM class F420-dependent oxidoreductase [Myxococcota bacterium]
MQLGVVFPQTEIGNDPVAIRDFVQAVEGLGLAHLVIYDHVLGADPDRPGGWQGPYDKDTPFHEPFVTLGYLAAVTHSIELVTGIIILPQRQTVLVAKQAAEVDLLSGGRLRLGVGTGWNPVEYQGLGMSFRDRGRRQEEQVRLLRELWENDTISFESRDHTIDRAGINPRPARRIPIWFGGAADALLRRAARIGDGWIPILGPDDRGRAAVERVRGYLEAEGRDPAGFGIQALAQARGADPDRWRKHAEAWRELGATHLALATMGAGLRTPDEHVEAARRFRDAAAP